MIADDSEGILRYLNDVSFQLACLLDIEGQIGIPANQAVHRHRGSPIQPHKPDNQINNNKTATNRVQNKTTTTSTKQRLNYQAKKQHNNQNSKQSNRVATRRTRKRNNKTQEETSRGAIDELHHDEDDNQKIENQLHQIHQIDHISNKVHQVHSALIGSTETHTPLDGQLMLSIADEIPIDQGASISPTTTHLSPIDPSIQFNAAPIHHQNYYTPQRSNHHSQQPHLHHSHHHPHSQHHLDSYHLHDEFNSGHETIPMTNSTHLDAQDQMRINSHQHQQHLIGHQQQPSNVTVIRNTETLDGCSMNSTECYPQQQHHHHHHHHHHQQQQHQDPHHHHQQPPQQQQQHHHHQNSSAMQIHHSPAIATPRQPHQFQYQLDHQWLGPPNGGPTTNDNSIQMGTNDSLEQVVSLSPVTHQQIDQVHFVPLYHQGYYNHHSDQLDSFQHMAADDFVNGGDGGGSSALANATNPSSPTINQIHLRAGQSHQHQGQRPHHQQDHIRLTSLTGNGTGDGQSNANNTNDDNTTSNNTSNRANTMIPNPYEQQHHHQHHLHHHQVHSQPPDHRLHGLETNYNDHPDNNSHHHHHHPHHHHHQHHNHQQLSHQDHNNSNQQHMMPLVNGIEPSAVILQDINLASATWSSPEDLYSI